MIWSNTASVLESTPSSTRNWFIGVSIDARACLQASLERVVVSLQSISVEKGTLTIFSLTLSLAPLSNSSAARIALSMKQQPEIGGKKERSGAPASGQRGRGGNQPRGAGNGGNRGNGGARGGNDLGNNWFDAALKK